MGFSVACIFAKIEYFNHKFCTIRGTLLNKKRYSNKLKFSKAIVPLLDVTHFGAKISKNQ